MGIRVSIARRPPEALAQTVAEVRQGEIRGDYLIDRFFLDTSGSPSNTGIVNRYWDCLLYLFSEERRRLNAFTEPQWRAVVGASGLGIRDLDNREFRACSADQVVEVMWHLARCPPARELLAAIPPEQAMESTYGYRFSTCVTPLGLDNLDHVLVHLRRFFEEATKRGEVTIHMIG
jgi:hypothetical protein